MGRRQDRAGSQHRLLLVFVTQIQPQSEKRNISPRRRESKKVWSERRPWKNFFSWTFLFPTWDLEIPESLVPSTSVLRAALAGQHAAKA